MMRVVCIGECMIELSASHDGGYALGYAGDVYNTAVYLKRSTPQASVQLFSATGDDSFSNDMRARWRADGIADDLAPAIAGAQPGLYVITLDARGERSFSYWRSASPARRWLELLQRDGLERLHGIDLLYLSGISLAILPEAQHGKALALLATLRQQGIKIAFDPNYRPTLWSSVDTARLVLNGAARLADILLPSEEDQQTLALTAPDHVEIATTLGARGCRLRHDGLERVIAQQPVPAASVVDTSGAGDSFNGAYLAARLQGHDPVTAAQAGLAVAARVVTAHGAIVARDISHPAVATQRVSDQALSESSP